MRKSKSNLLGNNSLGCCGLSGTFSPDISSVKVTNRFPKTGLPPQGVPFSIEVEVDVDRNIQSQAREFYTNWLLVPTLARCPDAVIAARKAYSSNEKVLAVSEVITDFTKGCVGKAKLTFPADYRPDEKDWIQLEVYDEGTTEEAIKNGEAKPLYTGQRFQPRIDYKQGVSVGLYEQGTGAFGLQTGSLNPFSGMFNGVGGTIKSLTTLIAVGTGGYLIWKNGDSIKDFVSEKIEPFTK